MTQPQQSAGNGRLGGHILADQLRLQGVDRVFCVPGESYLALLDGLYGHRDAISVVTTRHEAGAAIMADAHARLTGRPGICAVTRGPGATNASNGIHVAFQDSTPLIVLIGQVARSMADREAFQEIDYRRMFGEMAKWVAEIPSADRIPEYISRAFHTAMSGRPGPVILALPEDVLSETATAPDVARARTVELGPEPGAIDALRHALARAERPLLIVGGSTWSERAVADLTRFAERSGLGVAASFRCQDRFDNRHEHYVGTVGIGIDPALRDRIRESDCLVVAGARLGEITTQGYTLLDVPSPEQALIHVHPGAEELGRVYVPDLAIVSGMERLAAALCTLHDLGNPSWTAWREAARSDYLAHCAPPETPPGLAGVDLGAVISHLNEVLPDDAILTNGAGNYAGWLHRYFQYRRYGTQLAPTNGSMGYGVPAAIAAKLVYPDRTVVSLSGDGCFMMLGQELATAVQYDARVVFLVANNAMLATIRMHQERDYPGRMIATDLANPDFAALAEAYGAHGETVRGMGAFPDAFARACAASRPALIELATDPGLISPTLRLAERGLVER